MFSAGLIYSVPLQPGLYSLDPFLLSRNCCERLGQGLRLQVFLGIYSHIKDSSRMISKMQGACQHSFVNSCFQILPTQIEYLGILFHAMKLDTAINLLAIWIPSFTMLQIQSVCPHLHWVFSLTCWILYIFEYHFYVGSMTCNGLFSIACFFTYTI